MAETSKGVVGRIYGNLGRLLGGKVAAGVLSLAYMAIAARALGPADYGVLILVHAYVMTVGGIVEFPGWQAIVRYGAQALSSGDRPRLTRLLAFAGLVEGAGGMLAVLVAFVAGPWIGPRLGWSPTAIAFAGPYSLAVLASIRSMPAGYLQLSGRFDLLGAHNVVAPAVRLAGSIVALIGGAGLTGFLVVWLAAALAEWFAMWALGAYAAWGRLSHRDLVGGLRSVPRENPGLWRFMLTTNADVTISELSGRMAPLAVGWMLGPAAAGLYAIAQRATAVLSQPAQILGQAAYAELARLVASGEGGLIRGAVSRTVGIGLLAAVPVCVLVGLFGGRLAVLIAGDRFARAGSVMLWLALARTLLLAGPPISAALTALGRPGLSVSANLVSSVGLILLLPPLLDWQGLTGAGLHALVQAVASVTLLTICVRCETEALPAAVARIQA
ncbi:MAG: lipopolysaccharide biosynthesis protein [Phenylobacterium sp.]|uniref:lipopolysaccharide biosynthesis protein n=1 Tax=Phenylobacterium sp. TaxID=1871053 RepID=UPI001222D571|nr:lipopolysaccharide biosynthesis protein [Phenylobacterium sp.]TAJ73908.1 MAG: lipopolysaccharide biosynthesis protein [Phenylobacterium sp.]